MTKKPDSRPGTLLAHLGRDPQAHYGLVNTPVCRGSTILFDGLEQYEARDRSQGKSVLSYGRAGTPTTFALQETLAELDGAERGFTLCSGLAAVMAGFLAFAQAGDQVLVCDALYGPTRRFCNQFLTRMGVEVVYYDPLAGAGIAELFRPNTRMIFLESPGSHTFEVQDVPAITAAARSAGLRTVMDNTWATPLFFRPLEHGVDVAVQAATKYLVGHSDAMLGVVTSTAAAEPDVRRAVRSLGQCASPDDIYLALRGLRTLEVRLERHQQSALRIARWLADRPEVDRILYPALPEDPGHAIWRRDFSGASGLFGFVLARPYPRAAVNALVDGLEFFGIGSSWGGFESLMIRTDPAKFRTATRWTAPGPSLRIYVGLEDPEDLVADLDAGFGRLAEAAAREGGPA